ncbi:MAG: mannosyltransferase [Sporothrix thermara]
MLHLLRRQRPWAMCALVFAVVASLVLYGFRMTGTATTTTITGQLSQIHLKPPPDHGRRTSRFSREGEQQSPFPYSYSLRQKPPKGGVPPSKEMLRFWKRLLKAMMDSQPQTSKIVVVTDPVTDDEIQPDPARDRDRVRIDRTHLSDDLRDALRAAHANFVLAARSLGEQLPYAGKDYGQHEADAVVQAVAAPAAAAAVPQAVVPPARAAPAPQVHLRMSAERNNKKTGSGQSRDPVSVISPDPSDLSDPSDPSGSSEPPVSPIEPSRGIVMTAGGRYVGIAVTSILMLRRNGSQLPVQLFLDSDGDYDAHLCETVLPALGTSCHVLQRFWETTPGMPPLASKFQRKVFAILLSPFQQVLFLDADCWPLRSPDYLFAAAPFATHGLVTWPDFWQSTASPALYDVLGIACPPRLAERRSSESGVLLYDKARHGSSLVLAAYYNWHGPRYYYPLLSQGAIGQGDKETFLHAAMVLGSPFYAVHTPIGILGRVVNGTYVGAAMRQADPVHDYQLAAEDEREELFPLPFTAGSGETVPPTTTTGSEKTATAHTLFIHHNLFKIDLRRLGPSMRGVYSRNEHGALTRLWDLDPDLHRQAGYDVERAMWDEVRGAVCSHQGFRRASRECADLQAYYRAVFEE